MKHKFTITIVILCLFLIAQFVGLYVILSNSVPAYLSTDVQSSQTYGYYFYQILTAFIISFMIFVLVTKYKLKLFMKIWFFLVITIAISVSLFALQKNIFHSEVYLISLFIAIIFSVAKILRPSIVIHNFTEILVYPGIAAIFVPLLSPVYVIIFLILISIYDMWAVWHVKIMQKMAKFQMDELKIFGGFFIPYLTKEMRQKMKSMKKGSKKKIKVAIAFLGNGDVVFTIIPAGVFLLNYGLSSALFVIFGGLIGLAYILFTSEKGKSYPAMPFITSGIFLGLLAWLLSMRIF